MVVYVTQCQIFLLCLGPIDSPTPRPTTPGPTSGKIFFERSYSQNQQNIFPYIITWSYIFLSRLGPINAPTPRPTTRYPKNKNVFSLFCVIVFHFLWFFIGLLIFFVADQLRDQRPGTTKQKRFFTFLCDCISFCAFF